ncbi:MAG TPA: hypothetical protein VHO01_01040 [Jatrophihabitans sp.]|nr:hypothetical protein [Jatrophihabitans sp.]
MDQDGTGAEPAASMATLLARTRTLEPQFLDLDLAGARALAERLGLQLRVIDSDTVAVTADLRPNRMTVDVRSGRVTDATAG